MSQLLRAELIKLRTTRTFVAVASVAIATSLLLTLLISLLTEPTKRSVLVDVFNSDTSSLFILILAIVGISGEWRHHTITSSLLAAPKRLRFLAAKTLAFAAAGLALSLAISVAVTVGGMTVLAARDLPTPDAADLISQLGRNAYVAALLGALGVGIGALLRNQVVAVVGVLVLSFVIEPLLLGLAPDVGRFGPVTALPIAAADVDAAAIGLEQNSDLLAPGMAILALLAWIGALFAAGGALLVARDVD